jgi:hypothetical protein
MHDLAGAPTGPLNLSAPARAESGSAPGRRRERPPVPAAIVPPAGGSVRRRLRADTIGPLPLAGH